MTMFPKTFLRSLLVLALLAGPALAVPAGNSGTPTALAPLPGDANSQGISINKGGDVVGNSIGATTTGVVWDRHGNTTMLLPLGTDIDSFAQGINARGDAVGYSRSGAPPCGAGDTAVQWTRHGASIPLQPLPGDTEARAFAINNNGIVAGISLSPRRADCTAAFTAVRWDRHGNPTALTSPSATLLEGFANDITEDGAVSGFVNDAAGTQFAAVTWDRNNVPTPLPAGFLSPLYAAFGLNTSGVVIGPALDGAFASSALMWDGNGGPPSMLPPLGGDAEAYAISINNSGEVAGVSGVLLFAAIFGIFDPPATAVVWDKHGAPTALSPLPGDAYSYAGGMNEAGEVAGFSHNPGTDTDTAVVWR